MNESIKYISCLEPKQLILKEKDPPKKQEGKTLLKVKKIGVCGTDLHAYLGNQAFFKYPRILGHELAGEVMAVDKNEKDIKEGDRAIVVPYYYCGKCSACKAGKTNCCAKLEVFGVHIDGGMQEVIEVRSDLLLPANDLSYEQIAVVEPLCIGAHAIRRTGVQKGNTVTVMGCGPIGIGIIQICKILGATVIAVDVNDYRLQVVKEKFGADYTVNALQNAPQEVSKITNGGLTDIVFDATGNKYAIESGVDFMRHGGTFAIVGLFKGDLVFPHPKIHAKETSLLCSRNATIEDFKFVKQILKEGKFNLADYITKQVAFEEIITGFDVWTSPDSKEIKVMIDLD